MKKQVAVQFCLYESFSGSLSPKLCDHFLVIMLAQLYSKSPKKKRLKKRSLKSLLNTQTCVECTVICVTKEVSQGALYMLLQARNCSSKNPNTTTQYSLEPTTKVCPCTYTSEAPYPAPTSKITCMEAMLITAFIGTVHPIDFMSLKLQSICCHT